MTRTLKPAFRAAAAMMLAALGAAQTGAAPAAAPRLSRVELENIQAAVEAAVARVSRPAGLMFGRPSRAYHLKGYGAVVVLAPRSLPRMRRPSAHGWRGRPFADVLVRLERSIQDVSDPAERRRLEEALVALRPVLAPPPRDLHSLQAEAEAFRREAERAMEKAERAVLLRLGTPEDAIPVWPAPPLPPGASLPAAPVVAPLPPVPPAPPVEAADPPPVPGAPEPPGWSFWFGEDDREDRAPDRVLSEVRRAIVSGLGGYRGPLSLLGENEFVVVAVDFVPSRGDRSGSRTVVARVLKRDLAEHRAGRLSAAALHARVEMDEY